MVRQKTTRCNVCLKALLYSECTALIASISALICCLWILFQMYQFNLQQVNNHVLSMIDIDADSSAALWVIIELGGGIVTIVFLALIVDAVITVFRDPTCTTCLRTILCASISLLFFGALLIAGVVILSFIIVFVLFAGAHLNETLLGVPGSVASLVFIIEIVVIIFCIFATVSTWMNTQQTLEQFDIESQEVDKKRLL